MSSCLFENLDDAQKLVIKKNDSPILILAGSGSGKTKTLVHKIAYLVYRKNINPQQILMITFTNKAAESFIEQLCEIDLLDLDESINKHTKDNEPNLQTLNIRTLHSFCVSVLRLHGHYLGLNDKFIIYNEKQQLMLLRQCINIQGGESSKEFLKKISRCKNNLVLPQDLKDEDNLKVVYANYQNLLFDRNALDFDDLLLMTYLLFQNFKNVLSDYQEHFRYLLVDEFQDLSLAQYKLLQLLGDKYKNICVAGDPDQSIYSCGEAYPHIFNAFQNDFLGLSVIKLERNYRSSYNILEASQLLIEKNIQRVGNVLWTSRGEGALISSYQFRNAKKEAEFIVDYIMQKVDQMNDFDINIKNSESDNQKYDFSDFAVIYRMPQLTPMLEKLLKESSIPYQVVDEKGLYNQKEVSEVLSYLKVLVNPEDNESLEHIIDIPLRNIGKQTVTTLKRLADDKKRSLFSLLMDIETLPFDPIKKKSLLKIIILFKSWKNIINRMSPEFMIKKIVHDLQLCDISSSGYQNILKLCVLATKYTDQTGVNALIAFLSEVAVQTVQDEYNLKSDTVKLLTVQSAKGLEFKDVFLIGLEEGVFPNLFMDENSKIEEERRMMYMAMNRAQEKIHLFNVRERLLFGKHIELNPSRFLDELANKFLDKKVFMGISKKRKDIVTEGQMVIF